MKQGPCHPGFAVWLVRQWSVRERNGWLSQQHLGERMPSPGLKDPWGQTQVKHPKAKQLTRAPLTLANYHASAMFMTPWGRPSLRPHPVSCFFIHSRDSDGAARNKKGHWLGSLETWGVSPDFAIFLIWARHLISLQSSFLLSDGRDRPETRKISSLT